MNTIVKYLQNKGYNTVNLSFYNHIKNWQSWYVSNVTKFHNYKIYNGQKHVKQKRLSLSMAKKTCEDIANLLFNEKTHILVDDESLQEYVNTVLESNNMYVMLNLAQEIKSYTGTVAYVPFLDDVTLNGDGEVIKGNGKIKINIINANNIYPISWNNGIITECAFTNEMYIDNEKYTHMQLHVLEKGKYVIYNNILNSNGQEVHEKFKNIAAKINTNSDSPQFVIDKLNIVNNIDDSNPLGIALFANSIDLLMGLDTTYDSYINEFQLGKKRIFVTTEMAQIDSLGDMAFDENDVVFYLLPDEMGKLESPLIEVNMNIRAVEHAQAINDELNLLSASLGFGKDRYNFQTSSSAVTATEVISENSELYRTLTKHEIVLKSVLKNLVDIIIRLGVVLGEVKEQKYKVTIQFDDSVIEDKNTQRTKDKEDVAMGVMQLWEYRAKWYGEDEETAKKNVAFSTDGVIA